MKIPFKVLVVALVVLCASTALAAQKHVIETKQDEQFLYVMSAVSGTYGNGEIVLNDVPLVVYFADRPNRIAGHIGLDEFVELWGEKSAELKDDPPNAAFATRGVLSDTSVIEIESMTLADDGSLHMQVRVLEGDVPEEFDAVSIFIDQMATIKTPGVY